MKRVMLFIATNLAIVVVLSIVASVFGLNKFLTANGLNLLKVPYFYQTITKGILLIIAVFADQTIRRRGQVGR